MAQLVGGVVGAFVGSFIGMPQLGWMIGSALGASLQKGPTVEGPRVQDLKTQTAEYGAVIPVLYGSVRMAGNIFWATKLKEKKNKEKVGGKGGPKQTNVTYTYSASFASGICEGEILGVRRIWMNGELVFSASENATAGTITISEKEKKKKTAGKFRVYRGTENQMPDPAMEAEDGANNTPAYRGLAYVLFEDLQLEKFGNRIPQQVEFEVVALNAGNVLGFRRVQNIQTFDYSYIDFNYTGSQVVNLRVDGFNNGVYRYSTYGSADKTWSDFGVDVSADGTVLGYTRPSIDTFSLTSGYKLPVFNGNVVIPIGYLGPFEVRIDNLNSSRENYFGGSRGQFTIFNIICSNDNLSVYIPQDRYFGGIICSADKSSLFVFSSPTPMPGGGLHVEVLTVNRYHKFEVIGGKAVLTEEGDITTPIGWGGGGFINDNQQNSFRLFGNSPLPSPAGRGYGISESDGKHIWMFTTWDFGNKLRLYKIDETTGNMDLINESTSFGGNMNFFSNGDGGFNAVWRFLGTIYADDAYCRISLINPYPPISGSPDNSYAFVDFTRASAISKQEVTVASIVNDQLNRVKYDPSEYDTTQLEDIFVRGFVVNNLSSARGSIESLKNIFLFDLVESGDKLKFTKRSNFTTPVDILEDLTGLSESSGQGDGVEQTRYQELELPREISIQYLDGEADYRFGTQYSRRLLTKSVSTMAYNVPAVLSADQAKRTVDAQLYIAWEERARYKFTTSRKFANIEPTDRVKIVLKNGLDVTVRVIEKNEGANGILEFSAVSDRSDLYGQRATGVKPPETTGDQITPATETIGIAFNAPPLTNSIDSNGYYLAASGYGSGVWSGSLSYQSTNGVEYSVIQDSFIEPGEESAIGFCQTVLGNFDATQNVFDDFSTVEVIISGNETLESRTELEVLNGANVAWIGGEIVQFQYAELIAPKTYKLSRFLRGRQGTERYTGTHSFGDSFVLLNTNDTQFLAQDISKNGQKFLLKHASVKDETIEQVRIQEFINDGSVLKPLSPVFCVATKQPNNDFILSWQRRARLNNGWLNGQDVPLDEQQEVYVIEIFSSSTYNTIIREIQPRSLKTYTYTEAEQIADFGASQTNLFARVYQISNRIGKGWPGTFRVV